MAAGISLLVSGACFGVFMSTQRESWGRANDAMTALFAMLMIPAAYAVASIHGADTGWIRLVGTLCVAGLLTIAVTSGLTAAAKLDWKRSAKIGGVGFAALLLWMASTCALILADGKLPRALAWLGFLTLILVCVTGAIVIVTIRSGGSLLGEEQPPVAISVGAGLAYVCLVVWTTWLGLRL